MTYQQETIEGAAVAAGLWLRGVDGAESSVVDGALCVPLGLAPGEARDAAMRVAFAVWLHDRCG